MSLVAEIIGWTALAVGGVVLIIAALIGMLVLCCLPEGRR